LLILAGVVGVVYLNTLTNGFVFDDPHLVGIDPAVRNPSSLFPKIAKGTWWLGYRPLRTASYALDYALFGRDPLGFHLSNLVYHTLSGLLAYLIAVRLLAQHLPALFVALLFLVHPIQTDAVSYISGRRDILFGLFYLLGFFAFLRYRDTRLKRFLGLAVMAYLLSLSSKEMAATLPLLCFTYDLVWTGRPTGGRALGWRRAWQSLQAVFQRDPVLYPAMGVLALLYILHFGFLYRPTVRLTYYGDSFALTMLTVARILVHYLKLLLFPRTLNADYSYDAFPITPSLTHWPSLAALLFLALLVVLLVRLAPAHRLSSFGGAWFFLTLLPVMHIIPHHELMAEHYLYIPSFGVFLAAGYAVEVTLVRNWVSPRILYPVLTLVVLLLSLRTMVRNRDWKDDITLWTKTVETAPMAARARANLGKAHLRRDLDDPGRQELEAAISIKPDVASYHDDLGLAYFRLGRLAEAERELKEALRLNLNLVSANINLAYTYIRQGRKAEAVSPLLEALRIRPGEQTAMAQLSLLYIELGRLDEAEQQLLGLAKIRPKDPKLYLALGSVYKRKGKPDLAKAALEKAARYGGGSPAGHPRQKQMKGGMPDGRQRPVH
jgi:Flp pilus assembly protein TadD